jgi:hypothetical protein
MSDRGEFRSAARKTTDGWEPRFPASRTREMLQVVPTATESQPLETAAGDVQPISVCPHCGTAMIIVEAVVRGEPIRAPPTLRAAA